jgi:uncharacterized protein
MKISDSERLILVLLAEIHKHLGIKGGIDPDLVLEAVRSGNVWGLERQYPGIFGSAEIEPAVVSEVGKILEMWWFIEHAYERLSPDEKAFIALEAGHFGHDPKFDGFDGNNESEYMGAAQFLIHQLEKFPEFKSRGLNSHAPSVQAYRRMLGRFEQVRPNLATIPLSAAQIAELLKERVHAENR